MGDPEDIVCCAECRMLQERGARCAACGATTLVARLDQLFAPRLGASVDEGSTFSSPTAGTLALMGLAVGMGATLGYVGIVLGGGGVGVLMCFGGWGVGLAIASALHSRRVRLTRLALTAADAKLLPGPGEEHVGVVERSGEIVAAPVTGRHCLACTLSIVPGKGKPPYYWSAANAGFWLIGDDGRRVHVAGPVWIEGGADETVPAERTAIAAGLPTTALTTGWAKNAASRRARASPCRGSRRSRWSPVSRTATPKSSSCGGSAANPW